jgi:hypothetical protein
MTFIVRCRCTPVVVDLDKSFSKSRVLARTEMAVQQDMTADSESQAQKVPVLKYTIIYGEEDRVFAFQQKVTGDNSRSDDKLHMARFTFT